MHFVEEFPHIVAELPTFFDDYKPERRIDTIPSVLDESDGFLDIFIEDEEWLPLHPPECPV